MISNLIEVCIKANETDEDGTVIVDGMPEKRPFLNQKPCIPHEYTVDKERGYVYRTNNREIIVAGIQVDEHLVFTRVHGDVYTEVRLPLKNERQMIKDYFQEKKGHSNIKFLLD